jgi:hypothetical protein
MEQFIQSLFSHYTSSFFITAVVWMLGFGLMMNIFVVLGVTKLSMRSALFMTYRSHAVNVGIAAVAGRLITAVISLVFSLFSSSFSGYLGSEPATFVGMMLVLYLLTSYFFCTSFAAVACAVLERWLLVAHVVVGAIGYFVMKALGLFA